VAQGVQWVASAILVFGVFGEIEAIIALDSQNAGGRRYWVLWSVIFLTILVAAPPAVALGRFQRDIMFPGQRRPAAHTSDKPGAGDARESDQQPDQAQDAESPEASQPDTDSPASGS
jgi:hypothetical protein